MSLLLSVPFALYTGVTKSNTGPEMYCRETWPAGFHRLPIVYVVTVSYVLPLAIICSSYTLIIRHLVRTRPRITVDSPVSDCFAVSIVYTLKHNYQ